MNYILDKEIINSIPTTNIEEKINKYRVRYNLPTINTVPTELTDNINTVVYYLPSLQDEVITTETDLTTSVSFGFKSDNGQYFSGGYCPLEEFIYILKCILKNKDINVVYKDYYNS